VQFSRSAKRTNEWHPVNKLFVSAYCCPQRKHGWKGEAAGNAYLSDRTRDSEALGLDPRPGALR